MNHSLDSDFNRFRSSSMNLIQLLSLQ